MKVDINNSFIYLFKLPQTEYETSGKTRSYLQVIIKSKNFGYNVVIKTRRSVIVEKTFQYKIKRFVLRR